MTLPMKGTGSPPRAPKRQDLKKGDELYHPRPGKWWYVYTVIGTRGQRGISVSLHQLLKGKKKVIKKRRVIPWAEWEKMHLYSYPKEWKAGQDP